LVLAPFPTVTKSCRCLCVFRAPAAGTGAWCLVPEYLVLVPGNPGAGAWNLST
jgi:hypothetical protein